MAGYIYEWDEEKRAANIAKHGVDFIAVRRFDWTRILSGPDLRRNYGEMRILAYGLIDGRVHALVFTRSGATTRIISLRKANSREQGTYHAAIGR